MNFDAFWPEWNGKQVTRYGGECVALVAEYCAENNKPIVWGNAIDWANNPVMLPAFTWITNIPTDYNQVPHRGDILVWAASLPGSGGYGHTAIFDKVLAPGSFQSFDQNWGGAQAHFQQHNWAYVLGWFTPKVFPANPPAPHPDPAPSNPVEAPHAPVPAPAPTPAPVVSSPAPAPTNPTSAPAAQENTPPTPSASPAPVPAPVVALPTVQPNPTLYDWLLSLFNKVIAFLKQYKKG